MSDFQPVVGAKVTPIENILLPTCSPDGSKGRKLTWTVTPGRQQQTTTEQSPQNISFILCNSQ